MGEIKDAFDNAFREFSVEGIPSSGRHEPNKSDIRKIGLKVERNLSAAAQGMLRFATVEDMEAATDADDGQLAYVYANNDDPADPENTVYQWDGEEWVVAAWYFEAVAEVAQPLIDDALGTIGLPLISTSARNKFDHTAVINGYEIRGSEPLGEVQAYPPDGESNPDYSTIASQISGLIPVRGWEALTVSGLPDNTAGGDNYARQYAFVGADGVDVVGWGFVAYNAGTFSLPVPEEAYFWHFSVSQRNGLGQDNSVVQVEEGWEASGFVPFVGDMVAALGGKALLSPRVPKVDYVGTPDQLFDKRTVVEGYEVYNDGRILVQANSSYALIYVGHLGGETITVSGLQPAEDFPRFYNFHSATPIAEASRISGGQINTDATGATLVVPTNAQWLAISPRQRNGDPPAYDDVVIRVGSTPAPGPVAFSARVGLIDDVPLAVGGGGNGGTPAYSGGVGFALGDSITQTQPDGGGYLYPVGQIRNNWPDYAIPTIGPDAFYNFALSGAHFVSFSALTTYQRFENQITAAVDLAESESIVPRWLIVSLGTNDWSSSNSSPSGYGGLGDYATAMGKTLSFDEFGEPTTTLDLSVSLDAMRLGFARLRWHFPDAVMFCALPLQRADYTVAQMADWVDAIAQMAGTYGFEVIDCLRESGILKEFEAWGDPGRDLSDGLHTDASGQLKQGKLIAARLMARLAA